MNHGNCRRLSETQMSSKGLFTMLKFLHIGHAMSFPKFFAQGIKNRRTFAHPAVGMNQQWSAKLVTKGGRRCSRSLARKGLTQRLSEWLTKRLAEATCTAAERITQRAAKLAAEGIVGINNATLGHGRRVALWTTHHHGVENVLRLTW